MVSPFELVRTAPRSVAPPRVRRRTSVDVVDVLPGNSRIVFACTLPLLMIAATFVVQGKVKLNAASPLRHREKQPMYQALRSNALLLNRSCAPQLQSAVLRSTPLDHTSDSVRLVVGGGFAASGLSAVASIIQNVPGACRPSRVDSGFWSSLATAGAVTTDDFSDAALGHRSDLPPEVETRRHYLNDAVRLREQSGGAGGTCWLPWEISERYASVTRGGRALCVPFIIRHCAPRGGSDPGRVHHLAARRHATAHASPPCAGADFPAAHTLLMLASWLKVPSALFDDTAPSARMVPPGAQAAPTHP